MKRFKMTHPERGQRAANCSDIRQCAVFMVNQLKVQEQGTIKHLAGTDWVIQACQSVKRYAQKMQVAEPEPVIWLMPKC
jgi:hypothetical protein